MIFASGKIRGRYKMENFQIEIFFILFLSCSLASLKIDSVFLFSVLRYFLFFFSLFQTFHFLAIIRPFCSL